MNIFILDDDIQKCVEYYVNSHVCKMPTEHNQLLSTALHELKIIPNGKIYKPFSPKHPCAIWARYSRQNFKYLIELNKALLKEYTYRYGKIHAGEQLIPIFEQVADQLPDLGFTQFAMSMPDDCKIKDNPIESYRNYYNKYKQHIAKWKNRDIPFWFEINS